jgi:radical SAM protein with 4Fe4S-binding SPASM domain
LYHDLRKSGLDALGVSIYDLKTFDKIKQMKNDGNLVVLDRQQPLTCTLENRAGNIKRNAHIFKGHQRQFVNNSCNRPFSMITINPKGEVVLCCADMYGDVIMGNVQKSRLEEIWNNELFNYYRRTLIAQGRKNLKLCNGCSHTGKASHVFYPLSRKRKSGYLERTGYHLRQIFHTRVWPIRLLTGGH